jgi:hypothetical protein
MELAVHYDIQQCAANLQASVAVNQPFGLSALVYCELSVSLHDAAQE